MLSPYHNVAHVLDVYSLFLFSSFSNPCRGVVVLGWTYPCFKDARVGGGSGVRQGLETGVGAGVGTMTPAGMASRPAELEDTEPSVMIWEK